MPASVPAGATAGGAVAAMSAANAAAMARKKNEMCAAAEEIGYVPAECRPTAGSPFEEIAVGVTIILLLVILAAVAVLVCKFVADIVRGRA